MRVGALIALLGGCGFHLQPGAVDGAPGDDAPPAVDAAFDAAASDGASDGAIDAPLAIDAPSVTTCTVGPSGATSTITGIGGSGGMNGGTLACGIGELPIGVRFEVTPAPIVSHANQTLMVHVRVRCGSVTRTTGNEMVSTALGESFHLGLDGSSPTACNAYIPPSQPPEVMCPSGYVLTGIAGNQVDTTLYNSVSIRCSAVSTSGAVTATSVVLAVAGTGAYTNAPETANCPGGTAIVSLAARSGCGQDSLAPSCASLSCP